MLKYRIKDILEALPYGEYASKKSDLVKLLGKGQSTFNDWLKIKRSDKRTIDSNSLLVIAKFFNTDMEKLINDTPIEAKSKPSKKDKILRRQKIRTA